MRFKLRRTPAARSAPAVGERMTVEIRSDRTPVTWAQRIDAPLDSPVVRERMRDRAIFDWRRYESRLPATITATELETGRQRIVHITAEGKLLAVRGTRRGPRRAARTPRLPAWYRRRQAA